ncbi:class I SAM-dependent methyltransferase, partial [Candidatus Gracilibacteria bacterium]|nr:class I SAM-dependent methyltransferase [Candidatus Gracilibacteria bacterium]
MNREDFLNKLKTYGKENDIPNISLDNARFLRELIRNNNTKHLLEIGSANGYSTIHFADELEKIGGKITSIEFSQLAYEQAGDNFEQAEVTDIITHYFGDAREILPILNDTYDFVFIDGLKKESLNFLKLIWNKTE